MKNLFLLFLLATTVAWAQPGWRNDGWRGDRIGARLKLSDAQQKQFDKLHSDVERSQLALRSRIQVLRLDVRDAFREEKPDRGKVEAKVGEISKLQNEMKLNRLGFWFDVNKILTPEQQATWKEHGKMRAHRQMRRPGRGGMRGMPMDDGDEVNPR